MAFATGVASDYNALWTALISFLKTDADLVAAGQQWTEVWAAPGGAPNDSDIILKGPGLSGDNSVYVGMRLEEDVASDRFALCLSGLVGVIAGAAEFNLHANSQPAFSRMFLANAPMTYWFIANGRRFIVVAKISTVFEMCYAGLALPFSTPSAYPYPMFIGGTAGEGSASVDWRSVSDDHSAFYKPRYAGGNVTPSFFLSPEGAWLRCGDYGSSGQNINVAPDNYFAQGFTLNADFTNYRYGFAQFKDRIAAAYGGTYPLTPFTLIQGSPQIQQYGVLQGVFHVPGVGNSAESVLTIGGTDYLVVQNIFRTSTGGYAAIAME